MSLDRGQIVREALSLLDEAGLEGLTLRALAARLGVKAPALYWHFASKSALLDEMATSMLRDLLATSEAPGPELDWQAFLRLAADGLHNMLLSHRDGARVFSGTYLTDDSTVASTEIPLRILTSAGFSITDAVWAWQTVYSFIVGFTIEEQSVASETGRVDERFDPDRRRARLDGSAPLSQQASSHMFAQVQERFSFGIATIVDGLGARLQRGDYYRRRTPAASISSTPPGPEGSKGP